MYKIHIISLPAFVLGLLILIFTQLSVRKVNACFTSGDTCGSCDPNCSVSSCNGGECCYSSCGGGLYPTQPPSGFNCGADACPAGQCCVDSSPGNCSQNACVGTTQADPGTVCRSFSWDGQYAISGYAGRWENPQGNYFDDCRTWNNDPTPACIDHWCCNTDNGSCAYDPNGHMCPNYSSSPCYVTAPCGYNRSASLYIHDNTTNTDSSIWGSFAGCYSNWNTCPRQQERLTAFSYNTQALIPTVFPAIANDGKIHSLNLIATAGNGASCGTFVYPPPTLTPTPSATPTPTSTPTPTLVPTLTPTLTPTITPSVTPTPTVNQIYGWVYKGYNADRTTVGVSQLIANYILNLTGAANSSTTSQGAPVSGMFGNYIFTPLSGGGYNLALQITPTGMQPYPGYSSSYVIPNVNGNQIVDIPFITITTVPTPSATPTVTPTATPVPDPPTPTPSGGPCTLPLPTPVLVAPAHQTCTNIKPAFSATVSNPNKDSVWAQFYSDAYETFNRMGSVLPYTGGNSTWTPDGSVLNTSGGYWWSAKTKSPNCADSAPAPANLITMDYTAPPQPAAPVCTLTSQSLVSGACTFSCSWPADPETDASCSDTGNYRPAFWTSPASAIPDPGWIGNVLSTTVTTGSDGLLLYSQLSARDGLGNASNLSAVGGPFTCPKIIFGPTVTPAGPTVTPTITPTPTITLTPTPGAWIQVQGGDTYQRSYTNNPVPGGQYFITNIQGDLYNTGIGWSGQNVWSFPYDNLSSTNWKVGGTLSNAYNFTYFSESLKNQSVPVSPVCTTSCPVGASVNIDNTHSIYSYSGAGYYTLDSTFWSGSVTPKTKVTIFLVSGSLEITQNFSIPADYAVVFVVNGNIYVDGGITSIPGLYISSETFSIAQGSSQFTLNGMVYANNYSLNRTFHNLSQPAYKIVYQPQYMIALLPYLGRSQVNWTEVKP